VEKHILILATVTVIVIWQMHKRQFLSFMLIMFKINNTNIYEQQQSDIKWRDVFAKDNATVVINQPVPRRELWWEVCLRWRVSGASGSIQPALVVVKEHHSVQTVAIVTVAVLTVRPWQWTVGKTMYTHTDPWQPLRLDQLSACVSITTLFS